MLKTKTITTDKATLLVAELPEGAKPHNSYCDAILYILPYGYVETEYPVESDGSWEWQLIGRLPDITEGDLYTLGFRADNLSSILDKLEHLIIKNNIYFKNIYGETKPLPPWQDLIESEGLHVNYKHRLKLWSEAQSKVWDKERCYLFIKVD